MRLLKVLLNFVDKVTASYQSLVAMRTVSLRSLHSSVCPVVICCTSLGQAQSFLTFVWRTAQNLCQ